MAAPLRLALLQTSPGPDPAVNRSDALARASRAAAETSALIVLPELFAHDYFPARRDKRLSLTVAETYPYPSVEAFRRWAREHRVAAVVPTFIQRGENNAYNAAFLVDSAGDVALEARQARVPARPDYFGPLYFNPGNAGSPVAEVGGGPVGVLVGDDAFDPGLSWALVAAGARLLVWVVAATPDRLKALDAVARAAAISHRVWVAVANRTGEGFAGGSRVVAPGGRVAAALDGAADTLLAEVQWEDADPVARPTSPGWRVVGPDARLTPRGSAPEGEPSPLRDPARVHRVAYACGPDFATYETILEPERFEAPPRKERLLGTLALMEELGLTRALKRLLPRPASEEELCLAHDPDYVRAVRESCAAGGGFYDPYTPVTADTYRVARLAAGAAIEAVIAVHTEGYHRLDHVIGLVRPPGHHAERHRGMGYCTFNNAAVAARWAQAQRLTTLPRIERVLIVDWDVHHGNGTQQIFYDDPTVLFFSIHEAGEYPGSGQPDEVGRGDGAGYTVNVPLPPGSGDAAYLAAFREVLVPVADQFRPQLILISAGQDGHHTDLISNMALTVDGFRGMAGVMKELAARHTGGRTVTLLEGGYNLHSLPYLNVALFDAFGDFGLEIREPWPVDDPGVTPAARAAIDATRCALAPYWEI